MSWRNESERHALSSRGIRTTTVRGRMNDNSSLRFADGHEGEGIHIGDKNQYQHSRYRCPKCVRGLLYNEHTDSYYCRVHADVDAWDSDDIGDLNKIIEYIKELPDYEPDEYELEQFDGKSMKESWHDYFTAKLKYLKRGR